MSIISPKWWLCTVASPCVLGEICHFLTETFFLACNWGFWQKYTCNNDTKTGQHLLRSWVRRTLEISVAVASESFCNETRWEFWGQIALFSITEYYIKTSVCCSRHKIDLIRTLWMVEAQIELKNHTEVQSYSKPVLWVILALLEDAVY